MFMIPDIVVKDEVKLRSKRRSSKSVVLTEEIRKGYEVSIVTAVYYSLVEVSPQSDDRG
jgi:hypothetical protein